MLRRTLPGNTGEQMPHGGLQAEVTRAAPLALPCSERVIRCAVYETLGPSQQLRDADSLVTEPAQSTYLSQNAVCVAFTPFPVSVGPPCGKVTAVPSPSSQFFLPFVPSSSKPAFMGFFFLLVYLELAKSNSFLSNYSRRHLRRSSIPGGCRRCSVYVFVITVYEMPAVWRYISNVQATSERK